MPAIKKEVVVMLDYLEHDDVNSKMFSQALLKCEEQLAKARSKAAE